MRIFRTLNQSLTFRVRRAYAPKPVGEVRLEPGARVPPDPLIVRAAASEHRDRSTLAASIGASERQLRNWQQRHPEIRNALHLGDADRLARDFHLCLMVGSYGAF